jgi:hypothetical protein
MARRRALSVLAALALALSGFSVGVTAQAGGSGPGDGSEVSSLTHGPKKKCKKWNKKRKKGNKKAARKYKKHCKGTSGGGGGGGGGTGGTACAPYEPGTEGAEAETSVVKDEHTEEAPVEVTVPAEAGVPENPNNPRAYHNVQVDSSAAHTGLWVRFEFAEPEDMDLYLLFSDSSEAAHAAGYNPTPVGPLDGTGNGGHSEVGAEQLDGIGTDDCGGYTVDMRAFQNAPGDKTLKLWLGEAGCEPPCEEP